MLGWCVPKFYGGHKSNKNELGYSGNESISCTISGTIRVLLLKKDNPMINQKKGPACDYDKRDISVVICDTDSKLQLN
jgi:hypothetical protein